MAIFQKSVINNHLSQLDKNEIDKASEKFKENYSEVKISEIKKLKEEDTDEYALELQILHEEIDAELEKMN